MGVCAVVARKRTTVSEIAVAFTGLGEMAFLAPAFDQVKDTKGDPAVIDQASAAAVAGVEIAGDLHAPADYRRHIAQVAARRAVFLAYERAGGRTG